MFRKLIIPLLMILASCKGGKDSDIQLTQVKKGSFLENITEQGTIKAVNSIAVTGPIISYRYGSLKIAKIVEDGQEVEKGDTIIIFDPSEIKKAIVQAEQQLEIAKADYEKLISTQQSEIEDLQADLELARLSQEIARVNFETSAFESEATKKEIQLRLESATIALERAREQIENKKIIHKEDLLQKSVAIRQLASSLMDANNSMKNLFTVSPANGIAIKEVNYSTNQKWAVNDQPYSGSKIIELPDLSAMRAEVSINEVDISKILPGQQVEIRPDAYSDSVFTGEVESVANLAQVKDYKSKIKIFPVQIRIKGQSRSLLPGLTVSCRIMVSEIDNVLFIPLESLFSEQGIDYVYLKTGSGFKRHEIKTGAVNTDYAVVAEGLDENDMVALSNPFLKKEEVRVKNINPR